MVYHTQNGPAVTVTVKSKPIQSIYLMMKSTGEGLSLRESWTHLGLMSKKLSFLKKPIVHLLNLKLQMPFHWMENQSLRLEN